MTILQIIVKLTLYKQLRWKKDENFKNNIYFFYKNFKNDFLFQNK